MLKFKTQSKSYTISDTFSFADEIRDLLVNKTDILVLYIVSSVTETIKTLAVKAFVGNWFNKTHKLNISKSDLIELFLVAEKDGFFPRQILRKN